MRSGREVALDVGFVHVFADLHGDGGDAAGASFVVIEEVVGLGDVAVGEEVLVFGGGLPGTVRRLVVAHGEEGLLRVALLEPVEGEIADQIGAVAGVLFAAGGGEEGGIVVDALAGEDVPVVEAGGFGDEVPFADHGGLVSGAAGVPWRRDCAWGRAVLPGVDAVLMAVLAGENGGAAGRADGIGAEAIGEAHAAVGDAVDVRRLVDAAAVGGDGVGGMIVGHDVDDVGRGPAFGEGGGAEQSNQFAAGISRHARGTVS